MSDTLISSRRVRGAIIGFDIAIYQYNPAN
jgi:hypothetical protein